MSEDKPKGIEIKERGDNKYAYRVTTVWNSEKKKREKKSKYLGKWVDGEIVRVRDQAVPKDICELGNVALLWNLLGGERESLEEIFPESWEEILLLAFNRVIDPQPLKRQKEWFEKTYLSRLIEPRLSPASISKALSRVGQSMERQQKFFDRITPTGEKLIYDTTALFTYSEKISLAEFGYPGTELNLPQISLVLAFAREKFLPCSVRLVPGSVHDSKTLSRFLERVKDGDAVIVLDKGFIGEDNVRDLEEVSTFVLPLKRDSKLIDYEKTPEEVFTYRERSIRGTRYEQEDRFVYFYEDILLRAQEMNAYHLGELENFVEERAGKIALLSNEEFSEEEAYKLYKSRDSVEKAFHVFKNVLEVDTNHLQDGETLRGYVFASFVGLVLYYRILRVLAENKLLGSVSVKDVLLALSKVYACKFRGEDRVEEIPKKAREYSELFDLKLDLFPKTANS